MRRQLAGKYRPPERFSIFSRNVFDRSSFGKYDPKPISIAWWIVPALALLAGLVWFVTVSIRAWDIFQP